jgi:hypothetical protein
MQLREGVTPETLKVDLAMLEANIASLKQRLAERAQEIERLRRQAAACCPWLEQRWHRSH